MEDRGIKDNRLIRKTLEAEEHRAQNSIPSWYDLVQVTQSFWELVFPPVKENISLTGPL